MNIFKTAIKNQKGMTYVELIVVLSIFSILSAVVIYDYGGFQNRVEIKNLSADIALKIIEAQKAALSGRIPSLAVPVSWKPAYGVYFDVVPASENKKFLYFADTNILPVGGVFQGSDCTGECVSKISITKTNFIKELKAYYLNGSTSVLNDLAISFMRPDSGPRVVSGGALLSNYSYVEITVASASGTTALIKVYPSGRIDVE